MPINVSTWSSAGLAALQIGQRAPDGTFAGYAGLTATDTGDNSGMHRLEAAITAPIGISEPNRVPTRGDDHPKRHVFQFESGGNNGFTLEMGETDIAAEAFMQGSDIYTLGEREMHVRGISLPIFKDMVMLALREAQSDDAGNNGNGYENLLVFSTNGTPLGDNRFAFQAEGGARYACTETATDILPWGVDIATANNASDGLTYSWFSEYPETMECFISDGTIVAVPLTHAPVTVGKTSAFNADTGAALTVSSVNVSGKTATLSAAPTSGVRVVILYQTTTL